MEKKKFFQTKEGGLTAAFLVIMLAFVFVMAGLALENDTVCFLGFAGIVLAVLYSPFRVYVLDRRKQ